MPCFKIADKLVGDGQPAYIIAEIGNNHNGDFDMAIELVDRAVECKADAVKFQVKDIETAFPKDLLDSPYQGPNSFGNTYREHKYALEFSHEQYADIKKYCDKKGVPFLCTPFDLPSLEFLISLDLPAYKIASFHLVDEKLLRATCRTGRPLIVSTGMSTIEEIDRAVEIMTEEKAEFAILQCTSSYPTKDEDVHLSVIPELAKRYNCVVGYSGHDKGISIPAASVCFGSKIIEKHFTLDHTLKGPDHAASLEPKGLAGLVERTRLLERAIGTPEKHVLDCELKNRVKNRGY